MLYILFKKKCDYFQGAFHDTSSVILWAQQFGLFEKPSDSSSIAESTRDSNLFFIPGFGGLQAPINDPNATAGFIGLTPKSTKVIKLITTQCGPEN